MRDKNPTATAIKENAVDKALAEREEKLVGAFFSDSDEEGGDKGGGSEDAAVGTSKEASAVMPEAKCLNPVMKDGDKDVLGGMFESSDEEG